MRIQYIYIHNQTDLDKTYSKHQESQLANSSDSSLLESNEHGLWGLSHHLSFKCLNSESDLMALPMVAYADPLISTLSKTAEEVRLGKCS